ncbi:BLUF domain-containing protein [Pedobacter roseus]|uniref:BLUF domain-containing protein n=1 Tax=Pedobacter roseus TaxID=336820 RepID=A0A7G9QBA8_9SPHI|nr:BLUF domain-containing protein [Pedobacter roseus]QNN40633.1 BLUF domain-containing protein [Pedobacter roseus]
MEPDNKNITPIFYLIYSSVESKAFDAEMIKVLLNQSRDFNQQNGISGILLHVKGQPITKSKGRFMQLLEGDERTVRKLYKKIMTDSRHESVVLLQIGKYDQCIFSGWSMGFEDSDDETFQSVSGHFNLNEIMEYCNQTAPSDIPLQFLSSFYNGA